MAEIDKTFYRGTDAYSDGDEAENAILGIVRSGARYEDLDEVAWPTLYHLSPVRENICNWYAFAPGSRVLEVGAGCGAITGALCDRGLEVYSVDLSLRRSTINYERHRDCEGLHLVVGNLNEVAFPERFDYVLLLGVLEYAGRFTEGKDPYRAFLERLRCLLKPDGKLLVAIENRLGVKYLAGAPEDHLGEPFAGLRGYDPAVGIRTFSKSELTKLLEQSGFAAHRFYYPYPDYKFPLEIFTDETLASQHFGKPFQVFDRAWVETFPVDKVAGTLAEDGVAGALANSFLVEAATDAAHLDAKRVFYAKLNSGRNEPFRVGTKIVGTDAPNKVFKYAIGDAALDHIRRTAKNERRLGERMKVLQGELNGGEIAYPYCHNRTLEDALREAAALGDGERIAAIFGSIRRLALIESAEGKITPEFGAWFGDTALPDLSGDWTCPANVDMVPDNIFTQGDELMLADCEWVADFPVPVGFVLWRAVENARLRIPALETAIPLDELYKNLGIPYENMEAYRAWSWHFENRYVSRGNNERFARRVHRLDYDLSRVGQMEQELRNKTAHIEQLIESERTLSGQLRAIRNSPLWPLVKLWLTLRGALVRLIKHNRGE